MGDLIRRLEEAVQIAINFEEDDARFCDFNRCMTGAVLSMIYELCSDDATVVLLGHQIGIMLRDNSKGFEYLLLSVVDSGCEKSYQIGLGNLVKARNDDDDDIFRPHYYVVSCNNPCLTIDSFFKMLELDSSNMDIGR